MTGKRAPGPRRVGEGPGEDERGKDDAGAWPPPRRVSGEFLRSAPPRWELDDGPVSASPHADGPKTRMLDDEIAFDACDGPSALDLSSIRPAKAARSEARVLLRPPPGEPDVALELGIAAFLAAPPRDAVAAFAGYPAAPSTLFEAPLHAIAVVRRRRTLRRSLADAHARCSPDVELYEAAVAAADTGAVRRGALVAVAMLVCALLGAFVLGEATGLSSLVP